MKTLRKTAVFVLIAIIVISIGSLFGWYLALRSKTATTVADDAARGFGTTAPSAQVNGSTSFNSGGGYSGSGAGSSGALGQGDGSGAGVAGSGSTGPQFDLNGNALLQGNSSGAGSATIGTSAGAALPKPKTPALWHVGTTPIAGAGFGTASSTSIYYVERATGYVFRANLFTGEILRLSNTLMPKTYAALVGRNGDVIERGVNSHDAITTFSGAITASTSTAPGSLVGTSLANNLLDIAGDPDMGILFYTKTTAQGGMIGLSATWGGAKEKQIFSSAVGSWKPIVMSDGRLIIVEKAQDGALGYAYTVQKDGSLVPFVRAAPGLTVLPLANSKAFIFGTSLASTLSLFVQTAPDSPTLTLSIKTIADKCVWAPYAAKIAKGAAAQPLTVYCAVPTAPTGENFIENWYQGTMHTTDSWWRIDATTGAATQIYSFAGTGASIDVVDPMIDPSGKNLAFKNARDGSLWVLRLAQ